MENTIGNSILEGLIPGASENFLIDDDLRAISKTYIQRTHKVAQALYNDFASILEETLLPTTSDEHLKDCIKAMARATRGEYLPDFLTSVQPECGEGPIGYGNYDRLMMVLEIGQLHRDEMMEKLDQRLASHPIHILMDQNFEDKLDSILDKKSRLFTDRFNAWFSSSPIVTSSIVEPIAQATEREQDAWNSSALKQICLNPDSTHDGGSIWFHDWNDLVEKRFKVIKQILIAQGNNLVREGLPARMLSDRLIPKASFHRRIAMLQEVGVTVQDGESSRSGYLPGSNNIVVTTGLAKDLCKSMKFVRNIDDDVVKDNISLKRLLSKARKSKLHSKELLLTLSTLNSPNALTFAEQEDLEFIGAVDFLLSHELAHALFDYSPDSSLPDQRSREERADGFAFIVVDRTSETSMLKTFFKTKVVQSSNEQGQEAESFWADTFPGGVALLKIYQYTKFEKDSEHLSAEERMESIENLIQNPVEQEAH